MEMEIKEFLDKPSGKAERKESKELKKFFLNFPKNKGCDFVWHPFLYLFILNCIVLYELMYIFVP